MCAHIIVHNCRTEHNTEQFWLSSLLSSRQAPEHRFRLWEGWGFSRQCSRNTHFTFFHISKTWLFTFFEMVIKKSYKVVSKRTGCLRNKTIGIYH